MTNETFTPHTPDSDDLDSPEWSGEFERRSDYLMGAIERLSDDLIRGTITSDARATDNYARMLSESFLDLEKFLTLCEPGLKSGIALAAYDLLYCGYQLGRRGKAHPEIASSITRLRQANAGRASGLKRAQEASGMWHPHALELAKDARIANPRFSQDKIADYILQHWRLRIKSPGHATLKKAVSGWIGSGQLADKTR